MLSAFPLHVSGKKLATDMPQACSKLPKLKKKSKSSQTKARTNTIEEYLPIKKKSQISYNFRNKNANKSPENKFSNSDNFNQKHNESVREEDQKCSFCEAFNPYVGSAHTCFSCGLKCSEQRTSTTFTSKPQNEPELIDAYSWTEALPFCHINSTKDVHLPNTVLRSSLTKTRTVKAPVKYGQESSPMKRIKLRREIETKKFSKRNQKCQTNSNENDEKHPIPKPSQTIENKITKSANLPSGLAETEYIIKVLDHVFQNNESQTSNPGRPRKGMQKRTRTSMATPLAHSAQDPLIENTSSVNPQPKRDQRARHHNTQVSESIGRSDALDLEHLFRSFDECICATSTPGEDTKPCASCLRKFLKQDSLNLNVDDGSADVNLDLLFAEANRAQYFERFPPIPTPVSPRESLSSGSVENRSNFQSHFSEESAIEGNPSYLVGEEASSYSEGEECAEDNLTIDEAPDYVNLGLSVPFPEDNLTKFPIVRGVHPVPTPTLSRKNPSSGLFNSHSDVHSHSSQKSALENNPCSLVGDECNSRTSSTINDVANPSLDMDWIASCLGDINAAENSLGDIDPVANLAGDFGYSASPSGDIHTANTPDNHCVVRPSSYIDSNKGPSSNTDCNLELLFGENCKTQPLRDTVFNVNSSSDLECNSNPADGFNNDIEPSFLIDSNDSRLTNNDGNTQPSSNITSDAGPSSDISFESIQSAVNCNPKLSSDIPCIQESSTITFGVPKPPKQCRLIAKDKTQSGGISCNEANSLDIQCNKTKSVIDNCSAISSSNLNYKGITSPGHHSNSLLSCDSHCNAESTDVDCSLRLSPTMTESIGKDESLIDSPQFQAFFISNKTYSSQKEFRTDVSSNLSIFKRTVMAYKVLPETPNASSSINKEPVLISGKLRCVMEESSSSITLPMSDEVEPMPVSVELNPIEQDSSLQNTVLVPFAEHDPISGEHGPMENDSCSQKTLPGPVAELVPASKETGTTEKDSSLQNTVPVFVEEALVPVSEDTKPIQKDFSQKSGVTPTGEVIGSPKPGPVTAESSELSAMPIHNRHETVSGEPKQMTQSTVPEFRANVPTVRTSLITYEPFEADAFAVASSHDDNIVLRYFCSHCFCNFQLNSLNDHLCSTHNKPANVEIKVYYLKGAEECD